MIAGGMRFVSRDWSHNTPTSQLHLSQNVSSALLTLCHPLEDVPESIGGSETAEENDAAVSDNEIAIIGEAILQVATEFPEFVELAREGLIDDGDVRMLVRDTPIGRRLNDRLLWQLSIYFPLYFAPADAERIRGAELIRDARANGMLSDAIEEELQFRRAEKWLCEFCPHLCNQDFVERMDTEKFVTHGPVSEVVDSMTDRLRGRLIQLVRSMSHGREERMRMAQELFEKMEQRGLLDDLEE